MHPSSAAEKEARCGWRTGGRGTISGLQAGLAGRAKATRATGARTGAEAERRRARYKRQAVRAATQSASGLTVPSTPPAPNRTPPRSPPTHSSGFAPSAFAGRPALGHQATHFTLALDTQEARKIRPVEHFLTTLDTTRSRFRVTNARTFLKLHTILYSIAPKTPHT